VQDCGEPQLRVVTRREAREAGLRHYFTGKPCLHGHTEPRMTHNKQCLGCHRDRQTRKRAEQPAEVKAAKRASYRKHKPAVVAAVTRWQRKNPEKRSATQAQYRERKRRAAHP
jgi:hypothetical protein